jgi:rhamnosyltransferase
MYSTHMSNRIFGVVITYNPDESNIQNLVDTAKQVDKLVVVDNGSGLEIENKLDKIAAESINIEILKNGENLGIDKASNIGIQRYINDYDFVLTLDQDSELGQNMVNLLILAFDQIKDKSCVMVGPNIVNYGAEEKDIVEQYKRVDLLIASGCLIKTEYLKKYGLLDEYFFIDCNDTDLSLRIESQGFTKYLVNRAKLQHSMGYGTTHTFFGKKMITENYSPIRRYFQSRNSTEILKRYINKFPRLVLKLWYTSHIKANIKILLFEENKLKKLKYGFLGTFDSLFKPGFRRF